MRTTKTWNLMVGYANGSLETVKLPGFIGPENLPNGIRMDILYFVPKGQVQGTVDAGYVKGPNLVQWSNKEIGWMWAKDGQMSANAVASYYTPADAYARKVLGLCGIRPHSAATVKVPEVKLCDSCAIPLVDQSCPKCGVSHGDPCATCGRGGYHKDGCPESDASDPREVEEPKGELCGCGYPGCPHDGPTATVAA